jgi:hypothetical protein
MPYVTYNNGISFAWHDPSEEYELTGDEVVLGTGLKPPTPEQILKAFPDYQPPESRPEPTPKEKLAKFLQANADVLALIDSEAR